ncbi:MAG: hypothetical protein HYY44_04535, partial [Deltaproteobacteria bacterium]|nr:hypothetical protein [Deltaproteobacteria bacterium]
RVGLLFGSLFVVAATGWKIGYEEISPLFSSGLTTLPNALGFLFLSYLLQAQATRSLIKERPPSLFSLWRLKIVSDAYNKISFLTPFRGDTLFRKVLEKKRGVIEATEILILDRAISGVVARRLPLPISEPQKGRHEEADRSLHRLLESNRSLFWLSLAFHILSFISLVLLVYSLGRSISGTFTISSALLLIGVFSLFSWLFRFLPSSLGLFEIASLLLAVPLPSRLFGSF